MIRKLLVPFALGCALLALAVACGESTPSPPAKLTDPVLIMKATAQAEIQATVTAYAERTRQATPTVTGTVVPAATATPQR